MAKKTESEHPIASDYSAPVEHDTDERPDETVLARQGSTLSQDDINDMPREDREQFHPNMREA